MNPVSKFSKPLYKNKPTHAVLEVSFLLKIWSDGRQTSEALL